MPRRPDPKRPVDRVAIRDFAGLATDSDPHDLPPGASREQVNVSAHRPGELQVRGGYRELQFQD
jgi:hypothetical protein